jgi:hypothetical protein
MQPPRRKRVLARLAAVLDAIGDAIPVFVVLASGFLLLYGLLVVLLSSGILTGAVVVVALAFALRRPAAAGSGLLRAGAALLPDGAGARYAEEWCGEFYDLRSDGARWWMRLAYVAGVLGRAVPVLAVTLRLSRARAVD